MTTREKQFVFAGMLVGVLLAAVLYLGAARLHRGGTAGLNSVVAAQVEDTSPAHSSHPSPSGSDEKLSSLHLDENEQRQIGLQTVPAELRNLRRTLGAVAQVEQAETELATISARVSGRIDKLFVDFTGQSVRRGQQVALIYSPEILSTAEEYRLALENRKRLGSAAEAQAVSGADELVAAARQRLELWGLTSRQIDAIASSPQPQLDLAIYSPASGIVTERKVTQGQYVTAGEPLYTLSDLSSVWVKAEVYQPDLAAIRIGQPAEINWTGAGRSTHGRVAFIDPVLNTQTRTASVRIQVANPNMRLRPGMFVDVKFPLSQGVTLAVPTSAVVDTGTRQVVYLSTGNGNFAAREVRLGPPSGQYYPVLAGLKPGDRVVAEGNFLIDSQTRITSGMTGLFAGSTQYESGAAETASALQFRFASDPPSPKGGTNFAVHVALLDSSGKPVSDAALSLVLVMPAMPAMNMPEMRSSTAPLAWDGTQYTGTVKVPSSGAWNVEVEARRNGQLLGTWRSRLVAQ